MSCELKFVLNDGTEFMDKKEIHKVQHLFPPGTIEKMKPVFHLERLRIEEMGIKTVIRVNQDGNYSIKRNLATNKPKFF